LVLHKFLAALLGNSPARRLRTQYPWTPKTKTTETRMKKALEKQTRKRESGLT
jgi:hypothetical protein